MKNFKKAVAQKNQVKKSPKCVEKRNGFVARIFSLLFWSWFEVCAYGFKQANMGFFEVAVGSRAEDFLKTYGSFNHGLTP